MHLSTLMHVFTPLSVWNTRESETIEGNLNISSKLLVSGRTKCQMSNIRKKRSSLPFAYVMDVS